MAELTDAELDAIAASTNARFAPDIHRVIAELRRVRQDLENKQKSFLVLATDCCETEEALNRAGIATLDDYGRTITDAEGVELLAADRDQLRQELETASTALAREAAKVHQQQRELMELRAELERSRA